MKKPIEEYVRSIVDFPEPGIIFRDVTSVLQDADGFHLAIDLMQEKLEGLEFDVIAGAESRGFIFGAPLAMMLGAGFVMIRKPNKLPADIISESYELEYGTDTICMHADAIEEGSRVVVIDDLLATGGTACAACNLVKKAGGVVDSAAFVIELTPLKGAEKIKEKSGVDVVSMLKYDID